MGKARVSRALISPYIINVKNKIEYLKRFRFYRLNKDGTLANFSRLEADMELENVFDIKHSREMFQSLNKMRENRSYTDVTLSVKGEVFHAHKIILATSSRYFDAMFSAGMKESSQTEVEVKGDDLTVEAFRLLVDFIYTSVLPVTETNVLDVLEAADQLEILSVVEKCSLFIMHNLTRDKFHLETRLKIYRVADRHNLTELREQNPSIACSAIWSYLRGRGVYGEHYG